MGHFPKKRLYAEAISGVDNTLEASLVELQQIYRTMLSEVNGSSFIASSGIDKKAFLPDFSVLFTDTGYNYAGACIERIHDNPMATFVPTRDINNNVNQRFDEMLYPKVYRVNFPGFIYREHFNGRFSTHNALAVMVCKSKLSADDFKKLSLTDISKLDWTMLYRTGNGAIGSHRENHHGANMFPVYAGTGTYMLIWAAYTGSKAEAASQSVYFVPAAGYTTTNGKPLTYITEGDVLFNNLQSKTSSFDKLKEAFS